MPAVIPKNLKPYRFHGVKIHWKEGAEDVYGDCPFCTREGKFSINVETGLWRCLVCNTGSEKGGKVHQGGNVVTFLRLLWEASQTPLIGVASQDILALVEERGLISLSTVDHWGLAPHPLKGGWLLPGFSADGKIVQLYRYDLFDGKMRLFATPGQPHGLLGRGCFNEQCQDVFVCEGPWDGMALWELLRGSNSPEGVLAVPGAGTFYDHWRPVFSGKRVVLLYDNDHPKVNPQTGVPVPPAGPDGMRKVAGLLMGGPSPPAEIHYLQWGPEGYDLTLPSGYDLREFLIGDPPVSDPKERIKHLGELWGRVAPCPPEWAIKREESGGGAVELLPCHSWGELVNDWRKTMRWTEGLDRALSVIMACAASTELVGDQLWIKLIAPPSTGKSVMAEALSMARSLVKAVSVLKGLYSGWKSDPDGREDNSLVVQCKNKTLIVKDADTLLSATNLSQILSELRDLYDRVGRSSFKNRMGREYHGHNMTVVLCGTNSLRQLDSSELGERFLDCVIMERVDEEDEDEILERMSHQVDRNLSLVSNGEVQTQYDPDRYIAMQRTGGYLVHLRLNIEELVQGIEFPERARKKCIQLAKFVAFMRSRPSKRQEESTEREMGGRLLSQLMRLAKCLAVVLSRKSVDHEVMRRVSRVALDTARGRTLQICKVLYAARTPEERTTKGVAYMTGQPEAKERDLLYFLLRIGAVEYRQRQLTSGLKGRPTWHLTDRLLKLWRELHPPRPSGVLQEEPP